MRFDLKLNEVQYIQKQFHFDSLIGVERGFLPQFGIEKALKNKGVIVEAIGKNPDLSAEYRYLFSAWEKMRYSVVRPDTMEKDELFCVLANEDTIIIFNRIEKDIAIELIDFNSDIMDRILYNMADFDSMEAVVERPFNISLPVKEFAQILSSQKDSNISTWSNRLGIGKDDLKFYFEMINKEKDYFMYLCEDHREQIGTLIKVVKTPNGYYALKHVTPKESENERMVMMVGDAQMIINSIYVF